MLTGWTDKELVSYIFCLFVVCLMTPIRWKRTMWSNAWQSWLHLLSLESNTSSWAGDCTGLALIPCKDRFSFILTQATLAVPLPREVWRLLPRKTRQPWLAKVDGLLFTIWHISSLQCIGRVFEKGTKGWHWNLPLSRHSCSPHCTMG